MKKICICGKEFESKTGKARYCSQKCRFIDDEKNAMLQKRRSDIDLLKKERE